MFKANDLSRGSEVEPLRQFAQHVLARGEADVVMCGHSHFPTQEPYPTPNGEGLYINAGDWLSHKSYVDWDGKDFHLRYFTSQGVGNKVPSGESQPAVSQGQ